MSKVTWDYVAVRNILSLSSGLPYTQAQPDPSGKIPIYGSSGLAGYGNRKLSPKPTIVIGRVGEGGVGSVRYVEEPAWVTDNALWADRINDRWLLRFVAAYLSWLDLRRFRSQTGQPLITQKVIASQIIPAPSLGEQRRIGEILDSVDDYIQANICLIAKQRELRLASIRRVAATGLVCFDGIEASELHRGARRSSGSWSLVPLGSVLAGIDAGHSPDLEDTPAGAGQWGVLKVSAVGEDGFRPGDNKIVRNRALYDSAICVRSGDLLMTRANTSQLVGRSCIVGDSPPGLMLCDKTLRLQVDERFVPTRYIHIVLGLAEVRRQIEIAATGTSGSMKNISQHSIRQLMIPLGRPEEMRQVVEIDILSEAQISALRREVEGLRLLKRGLMDDLLTGQVRVFLG